MNTDTIILSTAYLAPVEYYHYLKNHKAVYIEQNENFVKQTFRSRCEIYSPNGLHTLSIPLVNRNHQQIIKDIKISYDYDWQKIHWRTLESSYKRSPFFEFYEDGFYPFYKDKKFDYLLDLNNEIQTLVLKLLKLKPAIELTKEYHKSYTDADDYRTRINPKGSSKESNSYQQTVYSQVFETRHGFIPNLSIVDLLFNQGNKATNYF